MTIDGLIFKGKLIDGNDVELTFHKDYPWIYNEKELPVVRIKLMNCKDLGEILFDSIDFYNDGVTIAIKQENNFYTFETTDLGGIKVKIVCDKVLQEESEYDREYFIDLIKETLKQRDLEYDAGAKLRLQLDDLKQFLNHELDIIGRKLTQADWLAIDKRQFLKGQENILEKIIGVIDKRER